MFGAAEANAFGAKVVAVDVDPAKLAAISQYGAALTLNPKELDPKALKGAIAIKASAKSVRSDFLVVTTAS